MKSTVSFFLGICLVYFQTNELETKSLFDGQVKILIPKNFKLMTKEWMKIKYAENSLRKYVFTDTTGGVNVAVVHSDMKASQNDIQTHMANFKNNFKIQYPNGEWIAGGIISINGRIAGFQEVITPTITDTNMHSLMFFTDMDGKLLLISFSCPQDEFLNWKTSAYQIRDSLVITD